MQPDKPIAESEHVLDDCQLSQHDGSRSDVRATIVTNNTDFRQVTTSCSGGCLVRIHPMDLHDNLFRLDDVETIVGRDQNCDLFLNNPSISRNHAVIRATPLGYRLEDTGSTNGTYVDEKSVSSCLLTNGVRIRFGNYIYRFLANDSIETTYHETVYSMMTKDGLTGCFNKRYLLEILEREFRRSQRSKRPSSLLIFDLDHFKAVNDTHGHLAGDDVLKEFVARVQSLVRHEDVLARFGGEEFALILMEAPMDGAIIAANAIREEIQRRPFSTCAGELAVTTSIGVSTFDFRAHKSYEDVLAAADQGLYKAKAAGRNCVSTGSDEPEQLESSA